MTLLLEECGESNWIPDETAPTCHMCRLEFTFFNRRHHCRFCGGVFSGEPCSFVMGENYPPAYRGKRVCAYCHTLYFKYADMVQQGAVFVKYSKDGKEKHDRHVWLTDNKGKQTIHWTISKPTSPLAVSAKPDGDRSIKLTDVERVLHFKQPGTISEPSKLVIKLESTTVRDLVLQTGDQQLFKGWLEALQAAHHVSHCTKMIEQRKQEEATALAADEQAKIRAEAVARRQSERQERQTSRDKIREKWSAK